ncbi:MAG TPA: PEP/pyruvate-binding domain-containing protein [Ignavibacteriaceae bacterium]|nr:PEP/pyruvate-binding domain-containing protein [Ignavibacteriaceae bacterium]
MTRKFMLEESLSNRIENFQDLMKYKIHEVLLVSSLYDYYLFEEDGRLYELIREEYQALNLSQAPEITHVTTAGEAIELLSKENPFDLVITTMHIEDMHVISFVQQLKKKSVNIPIILLAYDNRERKELVSNFDTSMLEKIFIWQGDYRLIMTIIKYVEDKMNLESDTQAVGVQSIILVEDNVKFYSSYLPIIYSEVFRQSQRLISEGVNLSHKFLRMRARPKILLCTTYEEAWNVYNKYKDYVLGIITDNNFSRNGVKEPDAGLLFAKEVRKIHNDIPILIQSSNQAYAETAKSMGIFFLHKSSPRLLHELHDFMMNNFGFGDFVFKTPDLTEVGRATNLTTLEEQLKVVPDESILYHSERNHFSNWLKARTEFWLAHRLRPKHVTQFKTISDLRNELINSIREYQEARLQGIITDFNKETFNAHNSFARIGGGSLGGKARGLGFINKLINNYNIKNNFDGVEIFVPSAVVLATDVFDEFIAHNKLENCALNEVSDKEVVQLFHDAVNFPYEIEVKLRDFLEIVKEPLAVRSSSLLEDSQFLPFAGVYQTYMIPNNHEDIEVRFHELLQCIKCVYASTFYRKAKDYMKATSYRLEEEKMAVIIQRLVGEPRENRFYPDFAGVAKSYNFYPVAPQKSSDGIAMVALGLGKMVVEGGDSVRFCPKYPKHLLQFYSVKETVRNAQQKFFALNLNGHVDEGCIDDSFANMVEPYELKLAEKDGTLNYVGSTYSPENDIVYDGISRAGRRVVTLAPILKQNIFPLAEILDELLDIGSWGMGSEIEIEFAVNMSTGLNKLKEFALLQMRPLVISHEAEELKIEIKNKDDMICESHQVLGNGAVKVRDIIVVDNQKFNRGKSHQVAQEVSKLNAKLQSEKKPYILIGVGRWGSLDQWLGIPVTWDQISGASVIVESGFKDFNVTPSQGSHFFQNITSFRVGYFTVNSFFNQGYIDWDWLLKQQPVEEIGFTKHLAFEEPITVKINGHQNIGVILKPGK